MIAILFILYIIIKLAIAAYEDAELRNMARRKGYNVYASSTGVKRVKDNKPDIRKNKW